MTPEGQVLSDRNERGPLRDESTGHGTVAGATMQPLSIEARCIRLLLRAVGAPRIKAVLWTGEEVWASAAEPVAALEIRDRSTLLRLLANPELGFGEGYAEGRIEVRGDLVALLEEADRARPHPLFRRFVALLRRRRRNSRAGSRHNVHSHYDIGNDFYRLWLDENMVYTCAYFASPSMTLEQAQVAKLDHVCRKVGLRPGQRVVEAGCGWGALALHMARRYGASVRAFNLSHEQIVWARERAREQGLGHQVEFVEDDYRNISGTYDAFVSVGMLEHVGPEHYRDLGRVIDGCLAAHGRGLIHSIGRNRPERLNAWSEKYIFPGAYMPALREMMRIFEPYDFSVLDVENLRLHYDRTLRCWLERFEHSKERVREMFDERFVRMWRLYLAGSIAGFSSGTLQLFQVTFARARDNGIPWTRAALYAEEG